MDISPLCLLCNQMEETHQHLFFQCSYSQQIWTVFTNHTGITTSDLDLILLWLCNPLSCQNTTLIIRLATQASLYAIWKERNSRLHSTESRPAISIVQEIARTGRSRLEPLTRAQQILVNSESYLATWFRIFDPIIRGNQLH